MIFVKLFWGGYPSIYYNTQTQREGFILTAILHYVVCIPCATSSDLQKRHSKTWNAGLVWSPLRRETYVTAHWPTSECLCIILSLAVQHWWLLLESLATQKQIVCCHWLLASSLEPWWTWGCASVSRIHVNLSFLSCMRGLVWYAESAIPQLWTMVYYLLIIGTICWWLQTWTLNVEWTIHSSHVSAWIDEVKNSLNFC